MNLHLKRSGFVSLMLIIPAMLFGTLSDAEEQEFDLGGRIYSTQNTFLSLEFESTDQAGSGRVKIYRGGVVSPEGEYTIRGNLVDFSSTAVFELRQSYILSDEGDSLKSIDGRIELKLRKGDDVRHNVVEFMSRNICGIGSESAAFAAAKSAGCSTDATLGVWSINHQRPPCKAECKTSFCITFTECRVR